MNETIGLAASAFGIGAALASAPGPVQAVIVTEAAHGGLRRGFRALVGAAATFSTLLALLALGVSISAPTGILIHLLEILGGAVLLWIAWNAHRSNRDAADEPAESASTPELRGALSVAANPGAWLFLGAVAAPLLATATDHAGTPAALLVVAALSAGAAAGDSLIVLAGGLALPRVSDGTRRRLTLLLHVVLAGLGAWLLTRGAHALTTLP